MWFFIEAMANVFQHFWGLSLFLSLYLIHSISTSHVTSVLHLYCSTLVRSISSYFFLLVHVSHRFTLSILGTTKTEIIFLHISIMLSFSLVSSKGVIYHSHFFWIVPCPCLKHGIWHIYPKFNYLCSKEDAKQAILYSYKHSFSGFAATLNSSQATILASNELINS